MAGGIDKCNAPRTGATAGQIGGEMARGNAPGHSAGMGAHNVRGLDVRGPDVLPAGGGGGYGVGLDYRYAL
jgi:hypothetical protein